MLETDIGEDGLLDYIFIVRANADADVEFAGECQFGGGAGGLKFSVFAVLLLAAGARAFAAVQVVEEIIAKVNGDIVTNGDLLRQQREAHADMVRQGMSPEKMQQLMTEHQKDQLRNKIDQLLLIQKAKDFLRG